MSEKLKRKSRVRTISTENEFSAKQLKKFLKEDSELKRHAKKQWLAEQGGKPLEIDLSFLGPVQTENFFPYWRNSEIAEKRIRSKVLSYVVSNVDLPNLAKTVQDYASEAFASSANSDIFFLAALAKGGDRAAFETLVEIASKLTLEVNRLAQEFGVSEFTRSLSSWPLLASNYKKFRHDQKAILSELQIGTSRLIKSEPLTAKWETAPDLALQLKARLDHWRGRTVGDIYWFEKYPFDPPTAAERQAPNLPPFDAEGWKKWANLAWEILVEENESSPESNPQLRKIGMYKKEKYTPNKEADASRSRESNVRDGIKQQLFSAFERLAKGKRAPFSSR